jgi:GAF domain-containing protein
VINQNAIKLIAITAIFNCSGSAFAHDGHGLKGMHWHATDVWGFVALAALVAAAIWLSRGDK